MLFHTASKSHNCSPSEEPSAAVECDKLLLTVGDGTNRLSDNFVNPPENKTEIISSSSHKKAANWVFKNFEAIFCFFQRMLERKNFRFSMQVSRGTEISRAILTLRSTSATKINKFCCNNFSVNSARKSVVQSFSSIE